MKIEIRNYSKIIKKKTILNNINLTLNSGMIYGLRGINGSGKTMLIRAICGLIYPSSGEIAIDGENIGRDISFPRSIGVLIESPAFLPNYTAFDNLKQIASIKNEIEDYEISKIIRDVGLVPDDKRTFRKFSLGMKQKLGIAAALMESPDILILDEPFNALDDVSVERTKKLILREKERGAIVILACHDVSALKSLSDQIIYIEEGRITKTEDQEDKQ
ncbi:MAG: ATP-binding cassette domain-containing protein [Oscillospiraceae bacterium]|nr:ATP-binding cassette domain-containing protein [Oscillospiraceae bacterium]